MIETRGGDDFSRDCAVRATPILVCSDCGARSCWHDAELVVAKADELDEPSYYRD